MVLLGENLAPTVATPSNYTNRGPNFDPGDTEILARVEAAPRLDEPFITHEWIDSRIEAATREFQAFRKKCQTADTFVLNEYPVPVPRDSTLVRLGTAHSVIKTLVAHVTPTFPDIAVPPSSPRGQARAEKLERFLLGANQMIERHSPADRQVAQHAGLYGVAFEKIQFEAEKWSEFPPTPDDEENDEEYRTAIRKIIEERDITWPIASTVVNPQELFWDLSSNTKPRWIIWQYAVPADWVQAHFGVEVGGDYVGTSKGEVLFEEVWTHSQVAYRADGFWARNPQKHGYRGLPWVMYWPQTGLDTVNHRPEHLYRGILDSNFGMLTGQSKLVSHYIDIVEKAAHPTTIFRGPPGLTGQYMSQFDGRPGAKNYLPQNVDIEVAETPRPPQEIALAKEMLDEAIEENTAPAVARGQRPAGAASGFHSAVLAGIAALNFGAVKDGMERGKERRNEVILNTVEHVIRDRVTVYGRTEAGSLDVSVGPNDIRGHTVNIVKISSVSPEEQDRKRNQAVQEWRVGFIDHVTALRNAGQAGPLEVIGNVEAEKFLQSEAVQMALQQVAGQRVPLLQNILEAAGSGQFGSPQQVDSVAEQVLNTQGSTQLPNPGNFTNANQPPRPPGTQPGNIRPVMPGSVEEATQVGRQLSAPRSGSVNVPGFLLGPGGRPR